MKNIANSSVERWNIIEKSVQFRANIRDISRRQLTTDDNSSKKLLLDQCDDYRLQMKYLGVEIKVYLKLVFLYLILLS